jgi:hypothetical protein
MWIWASPNLSRVNMSPVLGATFEIAGLHCPFRLNRFALPSAYAALSPLGRVFAIEQDDGGSPGCAPDVTMGGCG